MGSLQFSQRSWIHYIEHLLGMAFRFYNLKGWQNALAHSNAIDILVGSFPKTELSSLSSQMKRAADSEVLNITGGSTEYKRFPGIALRSVIKVVACLFIASSRNYITAPIFRQHYELYENYAR